MNITVIGIGKLGLCFALTLEKHGYRVVGVDVSEEYIRLLNEKKLHSPEPNVINALSQSINFIATTDIKMGLDHADILFLFVSTPSLSNGKYDHAQIDRVVQEIVKHGNTSKSKHLIIGCTTMPGYCDTVQDKLQSYGYVVSYNPEFIAQGSVMRDLVNPDILLIGQGNQTAGDKIEKLYFSIIQNAPTVHRMSRKEAEITKIALNCFLTTKIAYANMVGDVAHSTGCDPDVILNAVGSDSRIGKKNLKYGFGFGGPCFPRDNRAFALFAKDVDIDAVISRASDKANRIHLDYQVQDFVKNNDISNQVIITEPSYKPGTNIIDESQKLAFAAEIANRGYKILIKASMDEIEKIKVKFGNLFDFEYC